MIKITINILVTEFANKLILLCVYIYSKKRKGDLHCMALLAYHPFSFQKKKITTIKLKPKANNIAYL